MRWQAKWTKNGKTIKRKYEWASEWTNGKENEEEEAENTHTHCIIINECVTWK